MAVGRRAVDSCGAQRYAKSMVRMDIGVLTQLCAGILESIALTRAEKAEVIRIAQGCACKDSAAAAGVSPETIRARRKRIYRKLGMAGAGEVLSSLLATSLKTLAGGTSGEARQLSDSVPSSSVEASTTR